MGQMENHHNTATIPPKDEPPLSLPDLIASYGDRLCARRT